MQRTVTTFKKDGVVINCILGDCMDFLKEAEDKKYDLALLDPPYGIKMGKHTKRGPGWIERPPKDWDSAIPDADYWQEVRRVSQNQIVWGANYFTEHLPPSMGWIFWDKAQRNFSLADGELAWSSYNKALRVLELSRGKFVSDNKKHGELYHPTTKPVELYDFCLKYSALEPYTDKKIIDTHGGSMNLAVSCWKNGYNLDIIEIDKDYYEKSVEKLLTVTNQTGMF